MNIININQQYQKWKSDSSENLANLLLEFKNLANLEVYISDDAENYWETDCYKNLLKGISIIVKPDIEISDIQASEWKFKFKINQNDVLIEMKDPDTDWLQQDFIEILNELISKNTDTDKKLQTVYAHSESNSDQCFDLCFINDKTLNILKHNTPRYAFNEDDYNY